MRTGLKDENNKISRQKLHNDSIALVRQREAELAHQRHQEDSIQKAEIVTRQKLAADSLAKAKTEELYRAFALLERRARIDSLARTLDTARNRSVTDSVRITRPAGH